VAQLRSQRAFGLEHGERRNMESPSPVRVPDGRMASAATRNRRGREPAQAEQRSGPTDFANQLLTKMHGWVRIHEDGYGRELTNAQ